MKRLLDLSKALEGNRFPSKGADPQTYEHDEGLCEVLGQAADILGMCYVYYATTNATVKLRFFHASVAGRPSKRGAQIGADIVLNGQANPYSFTVQGPFGGRVEASLEVDSNDANQAEFQADIGLTLILDS
ncbi:MAG: hypothetical protein ABIO70_04580 [Pseudomonadota bacterium]